MKRGKNLIEEFKKFITRGNVIDMAVGVIIGGSFTTIVTSLNNDIITPILGIFGGVDFSNLKLVLGSGKNAPVLAYGSFITAVINFLIVAFILFALIKLVNSINESIKVAKSMIVINSIPLQLPKGTVCIVEPNILANI